MSDDTTRSRAPGGPEPAELRLRKALGTMNDLEPPRDDLFVQRAILRGRAATARRRSVVLGAAAAVLVVGGIGGTWYAANHRLTAGGTSSAASAPEAVTDSDAKAGGGLGTAGAGTGGSGSVPLVSPAVPGVRDATTWFEGPTTPLTQAFDAIAPKVVATWPDVFSGVYATDETNSHLVVALTRRDAALEALVSGAMPSPGDVEFTMATHSIAEKDRLAQRVLGDTAYWRAQGVQVYGVRQDGRADQVVVLADEGTTPGVVARHYGDLVRVVPTTTAPSGKLPDGSTLPTLQR